MESIRDGITYSNRIHYKRDRTKIKRSNAFGNEQERKFSKCIMTNKIPRDIDLVASVLPKNYGEIIEDHKNPRLKTLSKQSSNISLKSLTRRSSSSSLRSSGEKNIKKESSQKSLNVYKSLYFYDDESDNDSRYILGYSDIMICTSNQYFSIINIKYQKEHVAILVSNTKEFNWAFKCYKDNNKKYLFYPELVSFIFNNKYPLKILVNKNDELSEVGKKVLKTDRLQEGFPAKYLKNLKIKWIPKNMEIKIKLKDNFDFVKCYNKNEWIRV